MLTKDNPSMKKELNHYSKWKKAILTIPGHEKMDSMITDPPINPGRINPNMVTTYPYRHLKKHIKYYYSKTNLK
jgi:hypothetical protein